MSGEERIRERFDFGKSDSGPLHAAQSLVDPPPPHKWPQREELADDSNRRTCDATEDLGSVGEGKGIRVDDSRG
jgi:hypothetical protein